MGPSYYTTIITVGSSYYYDHHHHHQHLFKGNALRHLCFHQNAIMKCSRDVFLIHRLK